MPASRGGRRARPQRSAGDRDDRAFLGILEKALQLDPDFYTLWNARREALMRLLAEPAAADEAARPPALCERELAFTAACLATHPKSYWLWNHRRWCLQVWPQPNWTHELSLCRDLLNADARNCT